MKKLLLPVALIALFALPATADASPCRNAKGQFAKCGTPARFLLAPQGCAGHEACARDEARARHGPRARDEARRPGDGACHGPRRQGRALQGRQGQVHQVPACRPCRARKKGPCKDSKGKFVKC
jgi:hypothetical protein